MCKANTTLNVSLTTFVKKNKNKNKSDQICKLF